MDKTFEQKVGDALEATESQDSPTSREQLVELSSGVVLKTKTIPILLLKNLTREFVEPRAPKVYIEEKERTVINYQDPDYLAAKERHEQEIADAYLNVFAAYGTTIESLPAGVPGVMDQAWVDEFGIIYGDQIPEKYNSKRYLAWLSCVAILTREDVNNVADAVKAHMGVQEVEVDRQIEKFPSNP